MENKNTLGRNEEFGILYKVTTIRPNVISAITLVPEFMDALRKYKGSFNNEVVYEILKTTFIQMIKTNKDYRTARNVMNKVSKDVTGDSASWQN